MITNEKARYLIELPKKVVENEMYKNTISIQQEFPFFEKFYLKSENDNEFDFLMEIRQSKKYSLKLTLHCQEDEQEIGLVRIDYNGKHKNPDKILTTLPENFVKFAGKWIDFDKHHIHYFVEGYRPLVWAIPLSEDSFPIKDLKNNSDIIESIQSFGKIINLKTDLLINEILL